MLKRNTLNILLLRLFLILIPLLASCQIGNDRTESYLQAISGNYNSQLQMVVTILTTNRKDRYDAIKKLCCLEKPGIKLRQCKCTKSTVLFVDWRNSSVAGLKITLVLGGQSHCYWLSFSFCLTRASDRVWKKITNYAEIFRNIMRKKVLIMRKTCWIMWKIFGSLRSPKLTYFHAAEIKLLPKPRVCSQDNSKQKKLYWYLGFSSYFHLYLVCYEIIWSIMWCSITQPSFCGLKLIFFL